LTDFLFMFFFEIFWMGLLLQRVSGRLVAARIGWSCSIANGVASVSYQSVYVFCDRVLKIFCYVVLILFIIVTGLFSNFRSVLTFLFSVSTVMALSTSRDVQFMRVILDPELIKLSFETSPSPFLQFHFKKHPLCSCFLPISHSTRHL
jgi:hypothetical protein